MPNNSLYLRMSLISCNKNKISLRSLFSNDFMNSRHKGTSSVQHSVSLFRNLLIDPASHSVRADNHSLVRFKLINIADDPCALLLHIVNDILIVDYRTESCHLCIFFQLAVNHFHSSVHPEAETCGFCYSNLSHSRSPQFQRISVHPQQEALFPSYKHF